jgi:hypothetical protein
MTEEDAQEIGESVARTTYKIIVNLKRLFNYIKNKLCNPKKTKEDIEGKVNYERRKSV